MKSQFKFFHLNVRSCSCLSKFDRVRELLLSMDPHHDIEFIILSEAWIRESEQQLYMLSGYQGIFSSRPDGYGGLVAFVKESITARVSFMAKEPFNIIEIAVSYFGQVDLIMLCAYTLLHLCSVGCGYM